MSQDSMVSSILFLVLGALIGGMAVYIFSQSNRGTIVDFTRDEAGRIISVVEKRL